MRPDDLSFRPDAVSAPNGVAEHMSSGIVTADAVVLELDTAGVASRLAAGLIDALAQGTILMVVLMFFGYLFQDAEESTFNTILAIAVFVVFLGYPVVLETLWRGRTIGKRALGLRAVTVEGGPVRFRHAVLRMMGGLVDRFIPPGGITGALFVLGTRRQQRVGDLLAGTIVVREPMRIRPPALWYPVPHGHDAFAATIDPTPLTIEQYTVLRAFLMRVRELQPDARHHVATELAAATATVLRVELPPWLHPESFILCVVARKQRQAFPHLRTAR
jgi:uncharacterized RDD family membrane protein YckC